MSCRAVTFDFNGTLSDDEQILFGVYAELFAEHGRPLRADEYFTQLLDRKNRLGLSPEGERGTKDAQFDDSEAA